MPLGTLDRSPPPFFRQGPSALSKLMVCSALAVFLMVADTRFKITGPLRSAVAVVLSPVQWLALQPVRATQWAGSYFQSLQGAQAAEAQARVRLATLSLQAFQVEQLKLENEQLRKLLALRPRFTPEGQAAQVLYEAADPYTRKLIIDQGLTHGVVAGSPVVDEAGVLGQVTRVHPFVSEVSLLVDRDQATPVMNARTGARSVAYGDSGGSHAGALELRFMAANADVKPGDLLTTSGVDGVYPPGLPVAKVDRVERRADSSFARIYCTPTAGVQNDRHVMVLKPVGANQPARPPADEAPPAQARKGARK